MLAEQVRAARGMLGWSREYLAERAGVSPETVGNIEGTIFKPQPRTVEAVVAVLKAQGIDFINAGPLAGIVWTKQ